MFCSVISCLKLPPKDKVDELRPVRCACVQEFLLLFDVHGSFNSRCCLQIDGNVLLSMPSATGDDPTLKKLEDNVKKLTSNVAEYKQIVAVKDQV